MEYSQRLAGVSTAKLSIPDLNADGRTTTELADKVKVLVDFFAKKCTEDGEHATLPSAPYPLPEDYPHFDFPPISSHTVLRHLQRFSIYKSTSDRIINNRFLRECAPFLSNSISYSFNLSLNTATFPTAWKEAVVVPIFKTGEALRILPTTGLCLFSLQSARFLRKFKAPSY